VEELWLEEYKDKYSTPTTATPPTPISFVQGETFGGLKNHEQIKSVFRSKLDAYQAYIKSNLKEVTDPLAYWNSLYLSQPDLARFALDMLAIPLMSAECERVFSSAKHLITDSRNRLKADIIEANECLKSWFGRPEPGAFDKGDDSDIDEQEGEEGEEAVEEAYEGVDESSDEDDDQGDAEVKYTLIED